METHSPEVEEQRGPEAEAAPEATAETADAPQAAGDEAAQWQDRYVRLLAEFDNYKKRTQREKQEWRRDAQAEVLKDLLPTLDNLDRALAVLEKADAPDELKKGVELTARSLRATLDKRGVRPVEALGAPFDSDEHEAIGSMPQDDPARKGAVVEVLEPGYRFHDKILRYAKVITGE